MRNLYKKSYKDFRLHYGKHICRTYNDDREGENRLETFKIYFVRERTPPPSTTTSFTVPNAVLDEAGGELSFEACAEQCISSTKIDEDVSVCEQKEASPGSETMDKLLTRFTCEGIEVPEHERVKLWSHRCFTSKD